MKHVKIILTLANRQLVENRAIFALALICGLATLALPFVIGTSTKAPDQREFLENIRAGAQLLGMVVSYGVAFYTGLSLFGRELSEKRMGFFFSRPISATALWIGKLLGAWLLIVGSLLLVCLPAILMDANPFLLREKVGWPVLTFGAGVLPFLFCLGLTTSIAFRSKSWWLTVDLVSLMITTLLVGLGADRLVQEGALLPLIFGGLFFFVVAMTGMLVASRISLGQGRTSLRSVHRVMSLCLWSIVFLGVGLFDGYTRWVISVTPDDFTQLRNVSPISNGWFLIDGQVRYRPDYVPKLLHNPLTGQFVRVGDLDTEYSFPSVSPNGQYATWVHIPRYRKPEDSGGPYSGNLILCRLEGATPKPQTTSLVYPSNTHFEFSPDGASVAAITPDRVELISLQSHRIINQFSIPGELQKEGEMFLRKAVFPSPEILRLYRSAYRSDRCQMVEVNLNTKAITQTGWLEEIGYEEQLIYCPVTDRISYYSSFSQDEYHIADGRTGKRIFSLRTVDQDSGPEPWVVVLSDGRYAQLIPEEVKVPATEPVHLIPFWPIDGLNFLAMKKIPTPNHKGPYQIPVYTSNIRFKLLTSDGKEDQSILLKLDSLPSAFNSLYFCGEVSPGKVLMLINSYESLEKTVSQLFLIDSVTGEVNRKTIFNEARQIAPLEGKEALITGIPASVMREYFYRDEFSVSQISYSYIDPATANRRQLYVLNSSRFIYD
ncbi:MAG: hypothetical protein HY774_29000 [Acidobacteria bacterium]|nr:hypothetical protein [Acidobacteriota bacterium]